MPKIAKVGQLDKRISIIKEVKKKDKYGDTTVVDETLHTLWAKVKSQFLSEALANVGTTATDTITFIIRYNQSFEITTDMKIVYKNKKYNIIRYIPDETYSEWSTIICEDVR